MQKTACTFLLVHFGQQANWGPIARYATSNNTATRVLHCNKLLSMNSLFLIIFNNLYILYCKMQILTFQQGNAYLHSSIQARTA